MKEKNGEHPFGDAGQLICLVVFLVIWVGDSFLLHETTFPSAWVPLPIRLVMAVILMVGAVLLTRAGHVVAGGDARGSRVVVSGAFAYVRHPLYLGSLLFYLALAVATASLISIVVFLVILVFYNHIAAYEERLLVAKFGGAYQDYMQNTGKWVPRLRTAKNP
ncbi:MAG: isoprenylcysteine carboxylmethyltransferase family protein [bacterium]